MFIALFFSLLFTFTYATIAAKSNRAEKVLVPLLDVLQSVPILGFLTFLVLFFTGLFPGSVAGYQAAPIFAIFISQAWTNTSRPEHDGGGAGHRPLHRRRHRKGELPADRDRTLKTAVNWGRYGEIFAYDEGSET